MGTVTLTNSKIDAIHTDALESPTWSIQSNATARLMREAEDIIARNAMATAAIPANDGPKDQVLSVSTDIGGTTSLCGRNFDELIVNGPIDIQLLNGHPVGDLVTTAKDLTLDSLIADSLALLNDTRAVDDIRTKIEWLSRTKRQTMDAINIDRPLKVKELFVSGQLNGVQFSDLLQNALRTNAVEQEILAPINIDVGVAQSVRVRSSIVADQKLRNLVSIRENEKMIDQEVRFLEPVFVDDLRIMERLNQISMLDNRLDVLLKRSKTPQVITGTKQFESIKLLEPIFQQGKIQINSPIMEKIKPIVTIDNDLELIGDYSISGNLTIRNGLLARNLFGQSGRYSVEQLLLDGLRVNETNINVPIEFGQAIQVNEIVGGTSINGINVDNLIKRNVNEMQTISGRKSFTDDLYIENGFCDAFNVNGIDLKTLNETVLKRNAENQTINGRIHFRKIIAERYVLGDRIVAGIICLVFFHLQCDQ